MDQFGADISRRVWKAKCRYLDEATITHNWRRKTAKIEGIRRGLVTADTLPVRAHLEMQAALRPFVDNSISKTINVPEDCPFSEFRRIYDLAYEMGLKRCTTFRPNPVTGVILSGAEECGEAPHCCVLEREAD